MTPPWQLRRQLLVPWLATMPFSLRQLPNRWFVPLVGGLPIGPVTASLAYSTHRHLARYTAHWLTPFFRTSTGCWTAPLLDGW